MTATVHSISPTVDEPPTVLETLDPVNPHLLTESGGVVGSPPGVGQLPQPASSLTPGLFVPLTFSPQTCQELLKSNSLNLEQLIRDAALFRLHDPTFALTKNRTPHKTLKGLTEAFQAYFDATTHTLANSLISNSRPITNHPPPELTKEIAKLQEIVTTLKSALPVPAPAAVPSAPSPPSPPAPEPVTLLEPVSFHRQSLIIEHSVDDLITELKSLGIVLTRVGNRLCIHFGPAYGYGKVSHPARNYPESIILKKIEKDMQKIFPDFSFDKYALLITLYPDGTSSIPPHPDNEPHIKLGSSIITANIGATRSLVLTNTVGPLQKQTHELSHGDVYAMTRASQDQWHHSIPPSPDCLLPRISLTWRELHESPPPPPSSTRPKPPPITPPTPQQATKPTRRRLMPDSFYTSPPPTPTPVRVLFLSDSNNISLPTHLFPSHLTVIVKPLMQLTQLSVYENEFAYTDFVVIAGGVNELSRYKYTSQSLYSFISPLLRNYCEMFPKTTFVFSSLLRTRMPWLNRSVGEFNSLIFDLSLQVKKWGNYNLLFLDADCSLDPRRSLTPRGNGVHITHDAKKHYSFTLSSCLSLLTNTPLHRPGFTWPLRSEFMTRVHDV